MRRVLPPAARQRLAEPAARLMRRAVCERAALDVRPLDVALRVRLRRHEHVSERRPHHKHWVARARGDMQSRERCGAKGRRRAVCVCARARLWARRARPRSDGTRRAACALAHC
eukprot:4195419-Prymnesium_polylepis.1